MLSGNFLYAFKNKDSTRASCLIFLSGFTVAVANEVSLNQHIDVFKIDIYFWIDFKMIHIL